MSTLDRLNYVTFPALFLNFLMLLFPIILVVLIRGWFCSTHWRRHRARNTIIVIVTVVFAIQVTPMPAAAYSNEPVIVRALRDRLRDRLAAGEPAAFLLDRWVAHSPTLDDVVNSSFIRRWCPRPSSRPGQLAQATDIAAQNSAGKKLLRKRNNTCIKI